jgi:hypothetical protein
MEVIDELYELILVNLLSSTILGMDASIVILKKVLNIDNKKIVMRIKFNDKPILNVTIYVTINKVPHNKSVITTTVFLSNLSAKTPANGDIIIAGMVETIIVNAKLIPDPVTFRTYNPIAKFMILVPNKETSLPSKNTNIFIFGELIIFLLLIYEVLFIITSHI